MDLWAIRVNMLGAGLALALLCAGGAAGCGDMDLGDAPFNCNKGSPKCPDGYECNAKSNVCVREGTCPWPAVPTCPAPAPQAKFCHNLIFGNGAEATLIMKIGSVPLEAVSSKCSPCKNIPAGDQKVQITIKGDTKVQYSTTVFVKGGKKYMHVVDKMDAQNNMVHARHTLQDSMSCDEAMPAW